ncbi:MAG: DUF4013 domain-containing protein [Natronomonas sp.]|uniref:DUF4013 domain-containing protein n=1 Tax=Natronomonas sp. TaxID=2184060 RepID=UPI0028706B02|nr:DUF4013 domain-containing protein [Natronomonas sp.]MDR9429279.1 DUF4013 domain-containing protein [Natronomonas sp.]
MFREALDYPTRPTEGGRSVILGGLTLIVVAAFVAVTGLEPPYAYLAVFGLLPWLLVRGYYLRVVRTTIGRDRPTPPRFDDVRRLLRDGATAICIAAVYLLPGVAVLGPLIAIQVFELDLAARLPGSIPGSVSLVVVSIAGVLAIVAFMFLIGAFYVLPVAVARFAHTDDFRAAFEFRTVVAGATTEDYAIAWGVSVVLQALLLPIAFLFRILLVGFFLQFLVSSGVRYCYGQGAGAALGLEPVPASHERQDPSDWKVRPAVTRLDDATRAKRFGHRLSNQELAPAIRRIDEGSWPARRER